MQKASKNKVVLSLLAIILFLVAMFFCNLQVENKVKAMQIKSEQSSCLNQDDKATSAISNDVVRKAILEDKNIVDCAVISFGNIVGVAVRTKPIYFKEDLNTLKTNCIERIKNSVGGFSKIYFSTDLDLFLKAKNVEKQMAEGKSIFDMKDELLQILKLYKSRN